MDHRKILQPMIGLTLAGLVMVGCGITADTPQSMPTSISTTPTPTHTPTSTLSPTSEVKCPINCMADSVGWEVDFECEEEGQSVIKSYEGYTTRFEDNEPYVQGVVGFEFGTSGNVYRVSVNVEPCLESNTGYCITIEATGDMLGSEPVTCQNY